MGNTYFFTGFPGFLAGEVIREILRQRERYPVQHMYLLVLPEMMAAAGRCKLR